MHTVKIGKPFSYFMVKKPKNPAQLTKEEKDIINQVTLRCAAKLYYFIKKYHNPKEYAEKVILKKIKSDKDVATTWLVWHAKSGTSNNLIIPSQINKALTSKLEKSSIQD